jgi:alpha-glucosidase
LSVRAEEPATSRIDLIRGEKWWGICPTSQPFEIGTTQSEVSFATPMLLSSKGRYIWSATPLDIRFDGQSFHITSAEGRVQAHKVGRTLRDAYLVCRHKNFPPVQANVATDLYTLPIIETEQELGFMQSEEQLLEYARRMRELGIAKGIIVLADGWSPMDGSLEFNRNIYPNPKATIDRLHEMGFKVMLNISPYCSVSGRGFANALNDKSLLHDEGDLPVVVMMRGGGGFFAVCDIREEAFRKHIEGRLKSLTEEYGVDGFRFGCDELYDTSLCPQGQPDKRFLDVWSSLGDGYSLVDYTVVTPSFKQYTPCQVSASCQEPYANVNDMLTAGLMGQSSAYALPARIDINRADNLTLLRTLQQCLMMPMARIEFAPWRITDERLFDEFKRNLELRKRIGAHLQEVASEGAKTAEPVVRHLEYMFPRHGFADCSDQYMLGDKFMVVPVGSESQRMVRLPRGVWSDAKGKRHIGPVVLTLNTTNGQVLCFEKTK